MTLPCRVDESLFAFATDKQREILESIKKHGGARAAAKADGVSYSYYSRVFTAVKKKAAASGIAPNLAGMDGQLSEIETLKGRSIYYDVKEGRAEKVWIKTDVSAEKREEIMRAAVEAMAEDIPRLTALPVPSVPFISSLCNCYIITDYHLSMLSHKEETGADWDLKIAERTLLAWFAQAISQSPQSETAVFAQLSDLLHADGLEPLTPASKHVLDVDTRFYKVVRTVIRLIRQIVDMLLAKHKRLHIIMADANHDPVSQIWLREWVAVLYEDEPRITVDRSPSPYNAFEFGKVALFFHHGHKRKVTNVSEVFAAQFREMFGRTKYAYAHTGHLHSIDVKENNLMVVEQHRTLAAPDAYAARSGWLSGREAKVITYHAEYGEVSRVTINSDMLKPCAAGN